MDMPPVRYARTADGANIAYWIAGDGPLLLSSTLASQMAPEWQFPEARELYGRLTREFTFVQYEARGRGQSSGTTDLADPRDIEAVAGAVGFDRFALLGAHVPSCAAIAFAVANPGRLSHLVLWCALTRGPDWASSARGRSLTALQEEPAAFYQTLLHMTLGWGYGEYARAIADSLEQGQTGESLTQARRTVAQTDVTSLLSGPSACDPDHPLHRPRRLHRDAVPARRRLRAHDAAVRTAIDEFNGREVKHTGDGMMAAFGSAADAVSCALQVRRDIESYNDTRHGEELLVRFGINAGEPIAEDDDLFGLSVTLAARIGDWGEPGPVVVSNVVRELLLGKGFEFTSAGDATLKGFDEPVALYEVRAPRDR